MEPFIYRIYTPKGVRIEYRLDKAKEILEQSGGKLYAWTKELFPKKILVAWK